MLGFLNTEKLSFHFELDSNHHCDIRNNMADNPKLRGIPDNKLVSLKEAYEVTYWTDKFNCTKEQLASAVQKVGHGVGALKRHFNFTA